MTVGPRRSAGALCLLGGLCLLFAAPVRADTVWLTDGTSLSGRSVRIGDQLEVHGFSGVRTVPLSRVAAVEPASRASSPAARSPEGTASTERTAPGGGAAPRSPAALDPQGLFQKAWSLAWTGQEHDAAAIRIRALQAELSRRARELTAVDDAGWARLELFAALGALDPALVRALRQRARAMEALVAEGAKPVLPRTWSDPVSARGPRGRVVVIYPRSLQRAERRPRARRFSHVIVFGGGDRVRSQPRPRGAGGITAGAAALQGRQTFGATRGGRTTFDAIRAQRRVTFGAGRTQGRVTFRRARGR